uniref:Ig-like domain-containing protein n=1 Tax=Neogobius melanostomus TaxID=47308 RepID=A0A8C6U3K0_9GOBI
FFILRFSFCVFILRFSFCVSFCVFILRFSFCVFHSAFFILRFSFCVFHSTCRMLKWYVRTDTRVTLDYPSLSLLLPPVTCSDSGVYQCYMAAPVGEQNREGRVGLRVKDCPVDVVTAILNQRELPVLTTTALVLFAVLGTTLTCLCLRKAKWNKAKSVENTVYPDLSYPLEKRGLIPPNFTVVQNLKTSPPGFNSV